MNHYLNFTIVSNRILILFVIESPGQFSVWYNMKYKNIVSQSQLDVMHLYTYFASLEDNLVYFCRAGDKRLRNILILQIFLAHYK
jgi:hypothetical protein